MEKRKLTPEERREINLKNLAKAREAAKKSKRLGRPKKWRPEDTDQEALPTKLLELIDKRIHEGDFTDSGAVALYKIMKEEVKDTMPSVQTAHEAKQAAGKIDSQLRAYVRSLPPVGQREFLAKVTKWCDKVAGSKKINPGGGGQEGEK